MGEGLGLGTGGGLAHKKEPRGAVFFLYLYRTDTRGYRFYTDSYTYSYTYYRVDGLGGRAWGRGGSQSSHASLGPLTGGV